jgi:hypothetical protein
MLALFNLLRFQLKGISNFICIFVVTDAKIDEKITTQTTTMETKKRTPTRLRYDFKYSLLVHKICIVIKATKPTLRILCTIIYKSLIYPNI